MDNDSQLVARVQGGDERAFAELFRRHGDPVFRLALSILGQGFAAEAQDVVQEVFLKVHHALASFRGEAEVGSWIYRITFNQAVNLKARARYRRPHLAEAALAHAAAAEPGPHAQLETAQRDHALMIPNSWPVSRAATNELLRSYMGMHSNAPRSLPVRAAPVLLAGRKRGRYSGAA